MSKKEKQVESKPVVVESTMEIRGNKEVLVTKENGVVVSEQEM